MNLDKAKRDPIPRAQILARRAFAFIQRFLHIEAVSGIALLGTAAIALIWANSPLATYYHELWHTHVSLKFGPYAFSQSLHFIINDVLMTFFFLLVGMEIRREMYEGSLSNIRLALLPVLAALGGVLMPACIFLFLNHEASLRPGWAIPTATDIAFAVGILALLGRAIPSPIRIFLLTLAIIDDIVAVIIIAVFYSDGLHYAGFLMTGFGMVLVMAMQYIGIGNAYAFLIPGAIVWQGMLMSGAHPTLAGVVLGLMTPVVSKAWDHPLNQKTLPPVIRVQKALHPWVAYGVMPLFALANAGVTMNNTVFLNEQSVYLVFAVMAALVLGKPLGICAMSFLAVRLRWCQLPARVSWQGILLIGLLAGIGFTMSIFIAMLAFSEPSLLNAAKFGVLLSSVIAAILGLLWGKIVF